MLMCNVETIPGKKIVKLYGLVSGSTVRAKHVGRDIMASLKNVFGENLRDIQSCLPNPERNLSNAWSPKPKSLAPTPSSTCDFQHLLSPPGPRNCMSMGPPSQFNRGVPWKPSLI